MTTTTPVTRIGPMNRTTAEDTGRRAASLPLVARDGGPVGLRRTHAMGQHWRQIRPYPLVSAVTASKSIPPQRSGRARHSTSLRQMQSLVSITSLPIR